MVIFFFRVQLFRPLYYAGTNVLPVLYNYSISVLAYSLLATIFFALLIWKCQKESSIQQAEASSLRHLFFRKIHYCSLQYLTL